MGLVRVSGFMFQVLGVHLLSPPVSGGESGRSTDTDYRVQMTDYRGRHQLVGTRHAVSAKAKDDIVGVSDTACRVPTWRNKVRGHLKLET